MPQPGLQTLTAPMRRQPPNLAKAEAIRRFRQHADDTNDIFHIAAQLVADTLLRADKLLKDEPSSPGGLPQILCSTPALPTQARRGKRACDGGQVAAEEAGGSKYVCRHDEWIADRAAVSVAEAVKGSAEERNWAALQLAWRPYAAAWKAPWWECVAIPEDVSDAQAFRAGESCLSIWCSLRS